MAPHFLQKVFDVAMAPPYGGALLLPLPHQIDGFTQHLDEEFLIFTRP